MSRAGATAVARHARPPSESGATPPGASGAAPAELVVDLRDGLDTIEPVGRVEALTVRVADADVLDETCLFALQGSVVPGGRITFETSAGPRHRRRIERRLAHWFDGPPPTNGQRFVRPRFTALDNAHAMVAYRAGGGTTMGHFETLAASYRGEIPRHLVRHYRDRKLQRIGAAVAATGPRVLDIGCGVGLYAREVQRRFGAHVTAVDASAESVREAKTANVHDEKEDMAADGTVAADVDVTGNEETGARAAPSSAVRFAAGDALSLPFADAAFDVVYTINVCHHLKRGEQRRMLAEAARVLRPGGLLLVFEINTRNPLFRFYMRHVFPRTRDIDRGDEEFIDPRNLPTPRSLVRERVDTYTFLPDFLPSWLTRLLRPVERGIEATPMRAWGIHYTAILRRQDQGSSS